MFSRTSSLSEIFVTPSPSGVECVLMPNFAFMFWLSLRASIVGSSLEHFFVVVEKGDGEIKIKGSTR